jgi:outer membrane protein assembly complex protein YaeT
MAPAPALSAALRRRGVGLPGAWALAVLACLAGCSEFRPIPVRIQGAKHVGRDVLVAAARRELKDFEAHPSEAGLADAAYEMEQVLRQQGFAHGRVDFVLEGSALDPQRAFFLVAEGERSYLRRLEFTGAEHFTQTRLRAQLKADGIGWFGLSAAPYRRRDLDACGEVVETMYLLDGFYRVRIAKPIVTFSDDQRSAYAVIPVTEGRQYRVTSTDIDADLTDSGMTRADLGPARAEADIVGQPFYARLPTLAAARMRSWLADRGHLDAEVEARTDIDEEHATVSVVFQVKPGPVYVLRSVTVKGLDRTKRGFVNSRLGASEGKPISREHMDEGVRQLMRSGAFSLVRWEKQPVDQEGDTRRADVALSVTEAKARTLDFEVGYGTYEQLRGGIRYRDRNLFGQGRYWEVHPTASMKSYGADTHVRDNYLVGKNNVADLSAGYLFRIEPTFDLNQWTGGISLEHRFDQHWTTKGGYLYELSRATHVSAPIPGAELVGYVNAPRAFDGLRYDSRDSPVMPTRGELASVQLTYSSPLVGSELDFIEYAAAAAAFQRFGPRLVLALDSRYTTRQILNGATSLPIQERLFLGGENSVRSFREQELSPLGPNGEAVGGLTAAEATAELRWMLTGRWWTGLFYDIGEVDEETWHLTGTLGQAIGVGVRYQLPVGPVRFDLAYNPDRAANKQNAYLGNFAVGFSF